MNGEATRDRPKGLALDNPHYQYFNFFIEVVGFVSKRVGIMNEQRLICGVIVAYVIHMLYICDTINSNHYGSSYRKKTDSFSFGYRSP